MCCGIKLPRTWHDREAGNLDHGKASTGNCPARRAVSQSHDAEIVGDIEIAVRVGRDTCGGEVRKVIADVRPCCVAAPIVGNREHVARLGRRVEVIPRVRDPSVVRVCRIDIDPANEPSGICGR